MSEDANITEDVVQTFESAAESMFFYSNEKGLRSIDDKEIMLTIVKKYPNFNQSLKDIQLRKVLLSILNDKELIHHIMSFYQVDIQYLFRLLNRDYGSLFNTIFIRKVKSIIEQSDYESYKYY